MMNIRIDLFHHFEPGSVDQKLDLILTHFAGLNAQGAELHMDLTKLQAAVATETTVEQGAVTLLQALAQEVKDANASGNQAAVDAAADQIAANAAALAAAITANTPSAPVPSDPTL